MAIPIPIVCNIYHISYTMTWFDYSTVDYPTFDDNGDGKESK
jgi:hypothetical protein